MVLYAGAQNLPAGVQSFHILPTITLVTDSRENHHPYAVTVSWMVWGVTVFFG
jgi:hypothetical protein